jgi:NAD(P)-dependent dehydrogenase (short-subunit alcohol dehydrogenase family)
VGVLDGKVAIVTGASKGIGKGEALALAKEGAKVAVVARTYDGEEGVVRTAHELEALGATAIPIQCDVGVVDQVDHAVEAVVAEWGTVDILVNNAQIIYAMHPCEDWTESEMRATWESGLLGSWAFMVACFPHMKENGGRIINTCSTTGHGNVPGYVGYACTKEAIRALTRNAAREWARYGINVNTISPTALSDIVVKTFPDEGERLQALLDGGQVVGRWGDAEMDVGRAVVFLAGPDSGLITGCTLSVDGGAAML